MDLWWERRKEVFRVLREHRLPLSVLDAVERFRSQARARWLSTSGEKPKEGDEVEVVVEPESPLKPTPSRLKKFEEEKRRFEAAYDVPGLPQNAGEILAYFLRQRLLVLGDGRNAPVRSGKKLARSFIAAAAQDLLEERSSSESHLDELVGELMGVKQPTAAEVREHQAREVAKQVLAQQPEIGVRQLALALGVNPSSVSRWKKDPTFMTAIEEHRRFLESPRTQKLLEDAKMRKMP